MLTVIFSAARSRARYDVAWFIAELLSPWVSAPMNAEMPAMPLTLMMRPVQSRGMIGMNDCVTRSMPISLRLRSSTQSASGQVICRSCRRMPLPALLTTMWTVPNSAFAASAAALTCAHLADIGLHRQHLDALLAADLIGGLVERLLAARQDDEVDALLGEPAGRWPCRFPCWRR